MSDHKRRIKELETQIAAKGREFLAQRYKTEDEADEASAIYQQDINEVENEINRIKSVELKRKAARFGIDLSSGFGPWNAHPTKSFSWLEEPEQAKAERLISEAQLEWWKKWIDLVSPVASVIISIWPSRWQRLLFIFNLSEKCADAATH